jgi:hypothetical protein
MNVFNSLRAKRQIIPQTPPQADRSSDRGPLILMNRSTLI